MAKESSASRRARVKFQLRDRKGRWIEMGRGVKWYSPRLGREVSGTVVGTKGRNAVVDITSEPKGQDGKPQQVSVKGTDITLIESKASLGAPAPKPAKQDIPTEKAKLSREDAMKLEARTRGKGDTEKARKPKAGVAEKSDDDVVKDLMKNTGDMLKQADEARAARSPATTPAKTETAPVAKPKAEPKAKTDDKKGSQADSDKEDEEAPVIEEPDVAELEDEDLDLGDLEDNEPADASAEDEEEAGPTSLDDIEATIEELEAVVEEVASGDLDAVEIEEKLAEEVFVLVGNDGKQYDLDVKKDLEGKWSYRLKDEDGGETRAMIPADDNDSVEAGAQLNAVMNPKAKAKAKASAAPAKPKEEAPAQPEAETKPEAPEATPEAPEAKDEPEAKTVEEMWDHAEDRNVRDSGDTSSDFFVRDLTAEQVADLPVNSVYVDQNEDSAGVGVGYTKVDENLWVSFDGYGVNRVRGVHRDADFVDDGEAEITLPGHPEGSTLEGDALASVVRAAKAKRGDSAPEAKPKPEVETPKDTTPVPEGEQPEVETPKDTTPVPEGEQDELFPAPKSKAPGKNATDMKKELDALPDDTRIHFSDAMGENSEVYQKVTTNPETGKPKTLWAKVGIDESDDDGRLEVLDGSDYKKPGQLEKEREALNSAGIAKKHAGRKFETDSAAEPEAKGHMAPVKHRPPIKGDNKAGSDPDAAPESEDEEEEAFDDDDSQTDEEIWLDAQEKNRNNRGYNFNREQKEAYEDAIRAAEAEAGPEAYKDRPKWAETIKRHFDAAAEAKAGASESDIAKDQVAKDTPEAPAKAEAASSKSKTAKVSEDVATALKWRMDMEPDKDHGIEIDGENNVTITDPDEAEYIFDAASSDSHAVTNRPNEGTTSDIGKEFREELTALRAELGIPNTHAKRQQEMRDRIAADRAPKGDVVEGLPGGAVVTLQREATLEAGKSPADREDLGFNFDREGNFRVTDRDKAVETISALRDSAASNKLSRTAAQDAENLSKAIDVLRGDTNRAGAAAQETESDTPEAKAEPIMAMTIRAGRIKDELWAAIDTQETDGVDPGMRFNGNKLEVTDYDKARHAIDGQLAIARDNANDPESDAMERRSHKSLETGLTKVMTAINDHEEANKPLDAQEEGIKPTKEVTKDDLNARSLTQAEDAELAALEDKKVNDLVKGSSDFTPEDADRLKSLTRTSARRKRGNMVPENDGSTPDSYEGVDEVTALGEKISDAFVAGDSDEAHTAQRYLSGQDWNTALRDDTVSSTQAEQIDRLSGLIEKQGALPEGTKVYRGVGSLDFAGDPQVGDTFKEPGFMSTSLRREEAENFASGALIEITPRAGKDKALSISAVRQSADRSNVAGTIDALEGEGEVLFPHGTAMRVSAIETDAEGRKVVRVDVVDAPEAEEVNLEAPEAAPERPETAEAPATPETDSDAPSDPAGAANTTKKVTKDDLNDRFLTEAEEDELFALEEDEDLQGRAGDTPMLSPERAARKKSLLETQAKRRAGEMVDENTGSSTSSDTAPETDSDAVAGEEVTAGTPELAPAVTKTDDELDAEVASRMAELGIERTEPVTMEGEKYPPTRQQQDVIDAVMAGKDTKVQAMAGTGKTSTLEALSRRLQVQGKDAVYIAFNKTVQLEAAERMPKNVEARTGHSLANAWAREAMPFLGIRMANKDPLKTFVNPKGKTENMPKVPVTASGKIAGVLGIGEKSVTVEGGQGLGKTRSVQAVKRMVNSYALSDSDEVGPEHIPAEFSADDAEFVLSEEGKTALVGFAKAYWDDLSREDGVFRVAHDTYRKHWALSRPDLTDGSGGNKGADVLYIDEAQDTPAVLAKVVADQNMQKVIVGDANQAIYEFAENIDYLSQADSDIELPLNKSWRFGPVVADAGNRFLELLEAPNRVVGGGGESKRVVDMEDADAVLVRTNAGMVDAVLEEAENGRRVSAPDGTRANLKSLATSVQSLMDGERPENPHDDLVGYKNWDEVLTAFYQKDPSVQTLTKLFDVTDAKQLSKMTPDQHQAARENAMARVNKAIDAIVEKVDGFDTIQKTVEGKRTYLEVADDFEGTANQRTFAVLNFAANLGRQRDPYAANPSDEWSEQNKAFRAVGLGVLKADGWRFDGGSKRWYSENADTVAKFDAFEGEYDVMVSTAHKSKGLEWDRVRIGYDFPAPRQDENTGVTVMPEDAEYKLAYVAATRAKKELDMGGLDYVYELTSENGGLPKARKGDSDESDAARVEDGAVTPEAVPEPEDNTDVPATEAEASRYADPEPEEVADESVPEAAPEAPEATPDAEEVPESTPAPAEATEPVEEPVEPAPEVAPEADEVLPVPGINEDGMTPAEAAYAEKLDKAISDGYRTGMGNIQALQERLDELYDRGAARLRGEDPDAAPAAAPEVKPAKDETPEAPEAEEEVVPEAEEVVEEAPEPAPEAPAEAEADPVEVVEEPTEEGPQGDASDGEEEVEGGPTSLDSFEATASELFATFQDAQKTPRTPQELQDILEAEIYLLHGEDGNDYEFGLDVDDKGKWSYVLADEEGNELERYNVITTPPEEAGQKAFERVNGSEGTADAETEAEAVEEAPVDPADATPEAEEEVVEDVDRVEPEEIPELDPEVPEPAPMPEVEDPTSPDAQTPEEAPEVAPEEAPTDGTAAPEPDARPLHPVKQRVHNYPDGTQIKSGRTSEVIEKSKGKWHVAGSPGKSADPMGINTPLVIEMPKQPDEDFEPFNGDMDSLVPGDVIRTENGSQAAVVAVRNGKVMVMIHGLPDNQKALRANMVGTDPAKITGVIKFDAPGVEEAAPATPRTRTRAAGGAPIMDVDGNETKLGDRVMTAIGQGEVIALRPASGPNGSVLVRMDDGKEKSFRSNKFTNAAFAELREADDPATMEVGSQGTAADGRIFLVGNGNKPIHKGDRVALADGRIGTVAGIYAGAKSAGVKLEDGTTTRKRVSTLDAIDYEAPEKGPDAPEDGPDDNGGGSGGDSAPDAPESGPETGAEAPAAPAFSMLDALKSGGSFSNLSAEDAAAMQESMRQFASRISDRLPEGMTAEALDTFEDGELISTYDGQRSDFRVAIQRGEERVGLMSRTVRWWPRSAELEVHHDSFNLLPQEQNKGVAKVVLDESEAYYRSLGVSSISLRANIDVGGYAWARAGFDFGDSGDMEDFVDQINQRFKTSSWLPHTPAERKMFNDLAARATVENFDKGVHPTPFEFSQLGYDGSDNWLGKRIMLRSQWEGKKVLKPLDGPETSSEVSAPEVEAVTPEAPAEAPAAPSTAADAAPVAVFADLAARMESILKGGGWPIDQLIPAIEDSDQFNIIRADWGDTDPFTILSSGQGTAAEMFKASSDAKSAVQLALAFNEGKHDMWGLEGDLEKQHDLLYAELTAGLTTLSGGVGPAKAGAYDPETYDPSSADFSSMNYAESRFNPASEAGKALGFGAEKNAPGYDFAPGTRVRNTKTGAYGVIDRPSNNTLDRKRDKELGIAPEVAAKVLPSIFKDTLDPEDPADFRADVPQAWSLQDLEVVPDLDWDASSVEILDTDTSAETSKKMSEAFTGVDFDLEGVSDDHARAVGKTLTGLLNRFPQVKASLQSVSTMDDSPYTMASVSNKTDGQRETEFPIQRMMINKAYADLDNYAASIQAEAESGWLNPVPAGREVEATITHEFGHALDRLAGKISEQDLTELLKQVYPDYVMGKPGIGQILVALDIIPKYATTGQGDINVGELIAEAFADAELNATEARPLSKLIHQYLMERLRD